MSRVYAWSNRSVGVGMTLVITSVITLAVILAIGCGAPQRSRVAPAMTKPPRLVVLLVVDQWPSWSFVQRRPLLRAGLGRLIRDGVVAERAHHPHAFLYTASGHALIGTGVPPAVSGIIGNGWYRRDERRNRPAEYDPSAHILPIRPESSPMAAGSGGSAAALRVDGVVEALRAAHRESRSVSISLKARAAVMMAGRRPDLALWYDEAQGGFTSSSAYVPRLPSWLLAHATAHPVERYLDRWEPLDAGVLAAATKINDANPGEGDGANHGPAFPHDPRKAADPIDAAMNMPAGDRAVVDVALAAIDGEALGRDLHPDLLAISFSAHDHAGHIWGQESWEVLDLLLRLDREIERLLTRLDEVVGRGQYAVVVTSDHGAVPLIEHRRHLGARRIPPADLEAAAEAAVAGLLGPGDWIATVASLAAYASPALDGVNADMRERALDAAAAALAGVPGVARAGRFAALCEPAPPTPTPKASADSELDRALCASYAKGASGEIYIVPQAGSIVTPYPGGTHHDTPGDESADVPLIVVAPGVETGTWPGEPPSMEDVAPIVARLLGVSPPPAATRLSPAWLRPDAGGTAGR